MKPLITNILLAICVNAGFLYGCSKPPLIKPPQETRPKQSEEQVIKPKPLSPTQKSGSKSDEAQQKREETDAVELNPWKYYTMVNNLKGHESWVWSIAFSPDGKILASGGQDRIIRLWDVESGECQEKLAGHDDVIHSISFSPDGRWMASGCRSGVVRIWNTNTGKCLHILKGHSHWIYSVAFSHDGKLLASSSADKKIKLWDTKTWRCTRTKRAHEGAVWEVSFSHDDKYLTSCGEDNAVRLWRTETFRHVITYHAHKNPVLSVDFNYNSNLLVSAGLGDPTLIWSLKKDKVGHSFSDQAYSVRFYPGNDMLAFVCGDYIKIVNAGSGKSVKTLADSTSWGNSTQVPRGFRYSIAISPDSKSIAAAGSEGMVKIWSIPKGKKLKALKKLLSRIDKLLIEIDKGNYEERKEAQEILQQLLKELDTRETAFNRIYEKFLSKTNNRVKFYLEKLLRPYTGIIEWPGVSEDIQEDSTDTKQESKKGK